MLNDDMNKTMYQHMREIGDAWDSSADLCRKASSALRELGRISISASECIDAFRKAGDSALELCDRLEESSGKSREECIDDTISLIMPFK